MIKHLRVLALGTFLLGSCQPQLVDTVPMDAGSQGARVTEKTIYIPNDLRSMNLNDDQSEWSYKRSAKSANVVVFWQKGFGADPNQAPNASLRFDVNDVLNRAEQAYKYYRETIRFTGQSSRLDSLRMMVMVYHQDAWMATGAGYDNVVGAFWVSPAAVKNGAVMAHELGHSFQYQVACDGTYGYRDQPYVGTFWEQCAQYMARQLYPADALGDLSHFVANSHLHFSHETIRYQSFHLQEYWKQKRGADFLGRLWRGATTPEHPLETYKRITSLNQAQLNNEICEYAMRCINWDFPNGQYVRNQARQANVRFTTRLSRDADGFHRVETATSPQCYGFNAFQLTLPSAGSNIVAQFEGINTTSFANLQGWRYGFVAVNANGTASYSSLGSARNGQLRWALPANTQQVWFVVSGAPQTHFSHNWGLSDSQTPRFPYRVRFTNTQPAL